MTSRISSEAEPRSSLGLLWGTAAVLAAAAAPLAATLADYVPACLFKTWTGLPCPLCGTTRAAVVLANLDFAEAFVRYPLQSVFWTAAVGGGLVAGTAALFGRPLPRVSVPRWAWVLLAVAVVLNWIYSMVTGV